MKLYHFTSRVHLPHILGAGELTTTDSNVSETVTEPKVVWFMDTPDLTLDVSGASRVSLIGDGDDLRANVSGASNVDLAGFLVWDADLEASGASQMDVYVAGRLDAEASGASRIYYAGDRTLGRIETSGAGVIRPR